MGDKYEYPQANGIGTVTEDEASIILIPDTKNELYLYGENRNFSLQSRYRRRGHIAD